MEDVRLSKIQLDNERKLSRELKTEKTNFYSRRNQLEELFLRCVEETRKDIERRRAVTLARNNNLSNNLKSNSLKSRGSMLDDSLENAIKNEQFTASDRRKVLELLLTNENVLLFLYEKLFPRAVTQTNLVDQPHLTGATEHNYTNLGFRPKTATATNNSKVP